MSQPKVHVSLDLETLSTSPAAVILAIGAVAVCEGSGRQVSFYRVCSIASQPDRRKDASTLDWWEKQTAEARRVLDEAWNPDIAVPLTTALGDLTAWIGALGQTHQVFVWGNGSSFDVSILEHAYKEISPFVPWNFRHVRDMRTLRDLVLRLGLEEIVHSRVQRVGTHHNALDDAQFQANIIMASLRVLDDPTNTPREEAVA